MLPFYRRLPASTVEMQRVDYILCARVCLVGRTSCRSREFADMHTNVLCEIPAAFLGLNSGMRRVGHSNAREWRKWAFVGTPGVLDR